MDGDSDEDSPHQIDAVDYEDGSDEENYSRDPFAENEDEFESPKTNKTSSLQVKEQTPELPLDPVTPGAISIPFESANKKEPGSAASLDDLSTDIPFVFGVVRTSPRKDAKPGVKLQPKVIHVHGIGHLKREEIIAYFGPFKPASVEWINDASCNVSFWSRTAAQDALTGLGELEGENNDFPAPWFKGKPATKSGVISEISLRIATIADISPQRAKLGSLITPRKLESAPPREPALEKRKPVVRYDDLYTEEDMVAEPFVAPSLKRVPSVASVSDLRELLNWKKKAKTSSSKSPAASSAVSVKGSAEKPENSFDLRELLQSRGGDPDAMKMFFQPLDDLKRAAGKRRKGKGMAMYNPQRWK